MASLGSGTPAGEGAPPPSENYETAIRTLNGLQSSGATLAKLGEAREERRGSKMAQTVAALVLSGVTLEELDALDIVHVAGTKGKGMTCAYTESILRQAGLKTGFFSSPHLTAARERIRLNGRPLSEEKFAKYFFRVYHKLKHLRAYGEGIREGGQGAGVVEMPYYFRFVTILAFHVFLEEKVDAVVMEVGVGGAIDTTNIIRKPVVVGITALGLEHQGVLGETLEEIALHKAGIMKPGVPAFTVHTHPPEIQKLLGNHAAEVGCTVEVLEPLDFTAVPLGVNDESGKKGVAVINAGLAVRLANELLLQKHPHIFPPRGDLFRYSRDPTSFLPFTLRGLQLTQWDGRYQKVIDPENAAITYFMDGAHTADSIVLAVEWFHRCTSTSKGLRLLVFNMTKDREPHLMAPAVLSDIFDFALFCPMIAFRAKSTPPRCSTGDNWSRVETEKEDPLEGCRAYAHFWEEHQPHSQGVVLGSAEETLEYLRKRAEGERLPVKVLITGSLHLVGNFLAVLQPHRNDDLE